MPILCSYYRLIRLNDFFPSIFYWNAIIVASFYSDVIWQIVASYEKGLQLENKTWCQTYLIVLEFLVEGLCFFKSLFKKKYKYIKSGIVCQLPKLPVKRN